MHFLLSTVLLIQSVLEVSSYIISKLFPVKLINASLLQWRRYTPICMFIPELTYLTVFIPASPPSPSSTSCFLLFYPGLSVTLQWNSSFNSQHAVEKYRVAVTPDLNECSRENYRENYNCSGLLIGMTYLFRINAINCGDQEGLTETYTLVLKGTLVWRLSRVL